MTDLPLLRFALEGAPDVFEGIGPLEGVEDPVVVATEGSVEGLGVHGRRHRPGRPAADGSWPAAVVSHGGAVCGQE